jgi:hypothetical protein
MDKMEMPDECKDMKARKDRVVADTKAEDVELTALVAQMNSAPDDQKVKQMAAVVTRMVEQRVAADDRNAKMDDEMMAHMTRHMQVGQGSMAPCPMAHSPMAKGPDATPTGASKKSE